jgi:hypothetical protein
MPIDIRIRIDLSPRQKRVMRAAVVGGTVIAALGLGVALATVPNSFSSGQSVSANSMNQNFTYLDSKARFVAALDGGQYSVGATHFCGIGPTNTTGAISYSGMTGYAGAKAICAAATGCGPSATAHMCTGEELARSAQLGITPPTGWYSTYTWLITSGAGGAASVQSDCIGWTSTTAMGALGGAGPTVAACSTSEPVLCCD